MRETIKIGNQELTEEQIKNLALSVQKAGEAFRKCTETVRYVIGTEEFKNYAKARQELVKKINEKCQLK